jgi:hypothetical protein
MGVSLYLSFNPPAPEAELPVDEFTTDGSLFLNELYILDKIAAERNLSPLSSFTDTRQPPDDFDGDPDDFDRVMGPCDQWFDVQDALNTMDHIAALIENDPNTAERFDHPKDIRLELEEIASYLRIAKNAGVRFRFDVG